MAKEKTTPRRAAYSTTRQIEIRLRQIEQSKEEDYCHRDEDAFAENRLTGLTTSLVIEGQQQNITVKQSGKRNKHDEEVYILIGGHRRWRALRIAKEQNLDPARINDEMLVQAVEVVRGDGQSEESFAEDLLIRSISENNQRKPYTIAEILAIVKRCREQKVSEMRAASAVSLSETQYRRLVSIIEHDWLHKHVIDDDIGTTDAAMLIELAVKKKRVDDFRAMFAAWVKQQRVKIEEERQELKRVDKKLSESAEKVKSYLTRGLVRHWLRCLDQGKPLDTNAQLVFGILVDSDKGMVTVPGTRLKLDEISSLDLEAVIDELSEAAEKCLPLLKRRRAVEEASRFTDEDREHEMARIRERRQRARDEAATAAAGRDATDFESVERAQPADIDVEDEVKQREMEGEETASNVDDAGDGKDAN